MTDQHWYWLGASVVLPFALAAGAVIGFVLREATAND